ncbi:hypothetical protein ACVWZB_004776 [Paenibacillus polymyxa]
MNHKINRNYNDALGKLNLDYNKPVYLCNNSEIATCLICNRNYHEGAVNMIDYDVDVCVHCEPQYKFSIDPDGESPDFLFELNEEVRCNDNPLVFIVENRIIQEHTDGSHLYVLRLKNDNNQMYTANSRMLKRVHCTGTDPA